MCSSSIQFEKVLIIVLPQICTRTYSRPTSPSPTAVSALRIGPCRWPACAGSLPQALSSGAGARVGVGLGTYNFPKAGNVLVLIVRTLPHACMVTGPIILRCLRGHGKCARTVAVLTGLRNRTLTQSVLAITRLRTTRGRETMAA